MFSDVDECSSAPCQNSGSCTVGVDRYTCQCVAGQTGVNCEVCKIQVLPLSPNLTSGVKWPLFLKMHILLDTKILLCHNNCQSGEEMLKQHNIIMFILMMNVILVVSEIII